MTNKEFEDKFLIHRGIVTNYLKTKYKLCDDEVHDIVQNAFIKIYKRFVDNNLICEYPRQYLFNSAINCLKEHKTRKLYMRHEFTLTESNVENHEFFLDSMSKIDFFQVPDLLMENKTISNELKLLMEKLAKKNPESAEIVKMFYFDGMQVNEISEKLNIPINTIKTKLFRARIKLFKLIEKDMVLSTL